MMFHSIECGKNLDESNFYRKVKNRCKHCLNKKFKCELCGKVFTKKWLTTHIEREHNHNESNSNVSITNKVLYEIVMQKYNKHKKQYERDHNTIKSFDKSYRKSLQENVFDKTEYESLCNIFSNYVDQNENESF